MTTGPWVVVRCPSGRTMEQLTDLINYGIRAWTPVWHRRKRLPRTRKTRIVPLPCLPSYVFAGEESLQTLEAMREGGKLKGRVMSGDNGRFIRVRDHELKGLREASDSKEDKESVIPRPPIGKRYRIIEGPFQGLDCTVVGHTAQCVLVTMGEGFTIPVHIPYKQFNVIGVISND